METPLLNIVIERSSHVFGFDDDQVIASVESYPRYASARQVFDIFAEELKGVVNTDDPFKDVVDDYYNGDHNKAESKIVDLLSKRMSQYIDEEFKGDRVDILDDIAAEFKKEAHKRNIFKYMADKKHF